jgi:predicted HAD superfamily Cof-like phosphohydrolase
MEALKQVEEFHNTFGHPVLDTPQIPNVERSNLRRSLIREEFRELEEAIEKKDMVGIADALCDLQYVLSGTVLEFGLKDKFLAMFAETHSSNMSKACSTEEEAEATIEAYKKLDGTVAHWEFTEGKFLVYRTSDRKTLKSVNYRPSNLEQFFYE